MEKIKSFTSLAQSKKLAEILSIESADMFYSNGNETQPTFRLHSYGHIMDDKEDIPCWSLASLLNVLPRIDIEKEICSDDTYDYRVKAYIGDGYIGDWYDNPVDACVEMVIKLHGLKLL